MAKSGKTESKGLTESQKVFCEENFDLINWYIESFRNSVITFNDDGNERFRISREAVIKAGYEISEKFRIPITKVCEFAFSYHELTHLRQGIFTNRSSDHLYFVTDGTQIKIGRSSNTSHRIQQLQTSSPHKLRYIKVFHYRGGYEFKIHAIFKAIRIKGEWFKDDGQIRGYIRLLFRNNPDLSNEALFHYEY